MRLIDRSSLKDFLTTWIVGNLDLLALGLVLFALTSVVIQQFIAIPFGKFNDAEKQKRRSWLYGPDISHFKSWVLQEIPSFVLPLYLLRVMNNGLFYFTDGPRFRFNDNVLIAFVLHYFYRSIVYPIGVKLCSVTSEPSKVPLAVTLAAFAFNVFNASLQTLSLHLQADARELVFDGRRLFFDHFEASEYLALAARAAGLSLFGIGLYVTVISDLYLMKLKFFKGLYQRYLVEELQVGGNGEGGEALKGDEEADKAALEDDQEAHTKSPNEAEDKISEEPNTQDSSASSKPENLNSTTGGMASSKQTIHKRTTRKPSLVKTGEAAARSTSREKMKNNGKGDSVDKSSLKKKQELISKDSSSWPAAAEGFEGGDDPYFVSVEAAGRYCIPNRGWFKAVSCANYFGEIVEWLGFALMARNSAAWAFFFFTFCFLTMRALHHHNWYLRIFGEKYPKNRRAIIPFLL